MTCKVEGEAEEGARIRVSVEAVAWVRAAEEDRAVVPAPDEAVSGWEGRACVPSAADDRTINPVCPVWNSVVQSVEQRWSEKARRTTWKSNAIAPRVPTKANPSWKRVRKGDPTMPRGDGTGPMWADHLGLAA